MREEANKELRTSRNGLHAWLEDRLEVDSIWRALFLRHVPLGVNWLYTLGFASIAVFIIQAVTGIVLALYYAPTPDHAYDSVQYIMNELPFGQIIRGLHHWGASAMVVLVVVHMLVVFGMAAYKYPRELTWVVGVFLLLVTFAFGFTGYLLPWDEKAYWATTVGTNMVGTIPVIGGLGVRVVRGGAELGALTLTRFYAAHVMLLPNAILALIAIHLFMVIRQGVSVPPRLWDRMIVDPTRNAIRGAGTLRDRLTPGEYRRRYEQFKALGRPFFPDAIFEDSVAAVLVTLIVVSLAVMYGAPLESQADPTNTAYVPRPEWYFMFLFEMLKYFPGNLEWFGVVVIPGLGVLLLLVLPYIGGGHLRSPRYRPIGMTVASVAIVAVIVLTLLAFQSTPLSEVKGAKASLSPAESAGRQLVQKQGCTACHAVNGQGGQSGPSLEGIGSRRDPAYISSYIEDPKSVNPGATMPAFSPQVTKEQADQMAQYLSTLK
ncbi:MAG: cytochrome b N-terminal domain-containing protein [Chloroflexi bacterium]|nr:cytochrome b N-terminal domain-containing protein [Chloroflexota bacterium]